jgi:hypothetical protein
MSRLRLLGYVTQVGGILCIHQLEFVFNQSCSPYTQFFYNLSRHSVAGLSVDLCIWGLVGNVSLGLYDYLYLYDSTTAVQYKQRYPLAGELTIFTSEVTIIDLMVHVHGAIVWSGLCYQQYMLRRTWVPSQYWSRLCRLLVVVCIGMSMFIIRAATYKVVGDLGYLGLKWLDFVHWLWSVGLLSAIFQLIPQMMLNFVEISTRGLSVKFIIAEVVWLLIQVAMLGQHSHANWTYSDGYWTIATAARGTVTGLICVQVLRYRRRRHNSSRNGRARAGQELSSHQETMELLTQNEV